MLCSEEATVIRALRFENTSDDEPHSSDSSLKGPRSLFNKSLFSSSRRRFIICCLAWDWVWHKIRTNLFCCLPNMAHNGKDVVRMVDLPLPLKATINTLPNSSFSVISNISAWNLAVG